MALVHSWRMFRRMQHTILAVAALTYAGTALEAWRLPGAGEMLKLARTAIFPAAFLALSAAGVLFVPVLRNAVIRHLWTSYRTGFGQSVISVLAGVGVLIALAGFILWQIHSAAQGGRYPGGAFSGYAAGIGLLIAQAVLVRRMEHDPALRRCIEEQGPGPW
ncbi:MAG TPA: hypothetical protein VG166_06790 [Caulobacteraceae bacterium]|jgi:hypothetical protein|nr:hypothetical protein [Caulobacteraceae bacterium]